jgi:hypothetical protein
LARSAAQQWPSVWLTDTAHGSSNVDVSFFKISPLSDALATAPPVGSASHVTPSACLTDASSTQTNPPAVHLAAPASDSLWAVLSLSPNQTPGPSPPGVGPVPPLPPLSQESKAKAATPATTHTYAFRIGPPRSAFVAPF